MNLEDYVCPLDESALDEDRGGASARCKQGHQYEIVDGILRFITQESEVSNRSSRRFGYKWRIFNRINDYYVRNFLDEIRPLDASFFAGKRILDAGCGIGIPSYCLSQMAPARIFAADVSPSVDWARRNNRDSGLVDVVQADIYQLPYERDFFDIVVCVAVLHHLPDHGAALTSLLKPLKSRGTLILWVYGKEGNALVDKFVEPLRKMTTRRLPLGPLLLISLAMALPFHFVLLPAYRVLGRLGIQGLPMNPYLLYRSEFPFSNNLELIFDQLLAPESYLFERGELLQLLTRDDLKGITIRHHNGNSWTVFATKA
jgi:SAM-dependent methyltransferase